MRRHRDCRRHGRRAAFTLIELLVVIGIIAVLISILLPTLSSARRSAERTQCLSNHRQLAQALHLYLTQFKGHFPPQLKGVDSYQSNYCFHTSWDDLPSGTGEYEGGRLSHDGFVGLGNLVRHRLMRDGRAFYCPALPALNPEVPNIRYEPWAPYWQRLVSGKPQPGDALFLGYNYRVFYQDVGAFITTKDCEKLANLKLGKLGKFKGVMAMTQDFPWFYGYNTWAHTKPYGLPVGFSDGHAEFVDMGKKNYDVVVDLVRAYNADPNGTRIHQHLFYFYLWFAIDRNDLPEFQKLAAARDWNGAMKRYGHY